MVSHGEGNRGFEGKQNHNAIKTMASYDQPELPPAQVTDHSIIADDGLNCHIKPEINSRTPTSTATLRTSPMHLACMPKTNHTRAQVMRCRTALTQWRKPY